MSRRDRLARVDRQHPRVSVVRQCALLGVSRSAVYARRRPVSDEDLRLMGLIDRQYLVTPFYGTRRMAAWLRGQGDPVGRKRVGRLMRVMGLEAVYRKPRTSQRHPAHPVYPYLLRDREVTGPNQVWAADITYVPMAKGFVYLVAIMDWSSRRVLAWRLSTTMDPAFCVEALEEALGKGAPRIFTTDQGAQFTSVAFTGLLKEHGVRISMDGKGRWLDNVFVERLWRSVKDEEVYLKAYETVREARSGLAAYFHFYNTQRPHQALGYRTPQEVHDTPGERDDAGWLDAMLIASPPTEASVSGQVEAQLGAAGVSLNAP